MALLRSGVRCLLLYSRCPGLQGKRYLLANSVLKFDDFIKKKRTTLYSFPEKKDVFFNGLALKLKNSEDILDNELKAMLHLCETESDVQLAKECIYWYSKNADMITFKFGPVFLRLCYEFEMVDTAFEVLMDRFFKGCFSDITSFNILLGMLHQHRQYERALEVLLEMKMQRVHYNRQTYLLAFAICYELNSLRSLETCTSLVDETGFTGITLSKVSLWFLVALALKQEQYETALSVYDLILKKDCSLSTNLGLLIAAHTGNEEKVLQILESVTEPPSSNSFDELIICKEVRDVVMEKMNPTDLYGRVNDIFDKLGQSGQISSLTLDKMLYVTSQKQNNASDVRKQNNIRNKIWKESPLLQEKEPHNCAVTE